MVTLLCCSSTGKYLFTASTGSQITIWNTLNGAISIKYLATYCDTVRDLRAQCFWCVNAPRSLLREKSFIGLNIFAILPTRSMKAKCLNYSFAVKCDSCEDCKHLERAVPICSRNPLFPNFDRIPFALWFWKWARVTLNRLLRSESEMRREQTPPLATRADLAPSSTSFARSESLNIPIPGPDQQCLQVLHSVHSNHLSS